MKLRPYTVLNLTTKTLDRLKTWDLDCGQLSFLDPQGRVALEG